jgi:hypothetical protein
MAYIDIYTAATAVDSVLLKQVTVALFKAAVDIIGESAGTANHANRIVWAKKVTGSADTLKSEASRWIWKVLENTTIQAAPTTSPDNDIQFAVNSILDYVVQQ